MAGKGLDEGDEKDGEEWGNVEPMEGLEGGRTAGGGGGILDDRYIELDQPPDHASNLRYVYCHVG